MMLSLVTYNLSFFKDLAKRRFWDCLNILLMWQLMAVRCCFYLQNFLVTGLFLFSNSIQNFQMGFWGFGVLGFWV